MPKLTEQIRNDLTESIKARDAARTSTLRLLQSSLKNEQIEKGRELTDEEVHALIRKAVKQRQDSIEQFTKASRTELADKEKAELPILEKYLPAQMSDEDAEVAIRAIIDSVGATSKKDTGKVMKEIMAQHKGAIDGRKVQEIVGKLLT
ncbi:MAG TPA: GatB/YqeY domain-containing protein [Thermoanaerobaculia bacterium]|nr:GatB/YqeY domain-containing protein [Thermoanaerobaculia bacterium]